MVESKGRCLTMKQLSPQELTLRKLNPNYFLNGKPKRGSRMCCSRAYVAEINASPRSVNREWLCAGLQCPLYELGCDNRGYDGD